MSDKLWELLWRYDPNGLVVVDENLNIIRTNPSFCKIFQVNEKQVIGRALSDILPDVEDFEKVLRGERESVKKLRRYQNYGIVLQEIIFKVSEEKVVAGIFIDRTQEERERENYLRLQRETATRVKEVIHKQMSVAQEIASLLGETTAETKSSLLNLLRLIEKQSS